jgi:hypothetical protein
MYIIEKKMKSQIALIMSLRDIKRVSVIFIITRTDVKRACVSKEKVYDELKQIIGSSSSKETNQI